MTTTQNGDLTVNCKVCYDLFDYDLIKYVSPNVDANIVHLSTNGYYYFDIDGLTVTFFSPVKSDELIYHIVICMLSYDELDKHGLTYSELMTIPHTLTFDLDSMTNESTDGSTEQLADRLTNGSTNTSTNAPTDSSTDDSIHVYDAVLSVD